MQATDPERLYRWFLTERSKFAVQLTKQGEIGPRNPGKHEEQT